MFSKEAPSEDPAYYDDLAKKAFEKGDYNKATSNYKKALALREKTLPTGDVAIIRNYYDVGDASRLRRDPKGSAEYFEMALILCNKHHPEEAKLLSDILLKLGYSHLYFKQIDVAEGCLERCLELRKGLEPRDPRAIAEAYEGLAIHADLSGNVEKRLEYCDLRIEEVRTIDPPDLNLEYDALFDRAKAQYKLQQYAACKETLEECKALLDRFPVPNKNLQRTIDDSMRAINRKLNKAGKKGLF
jgi:tetratricopeptide (TPR) repeat protein